MRYCYCKNTLTRNNDSTSSDFAPPGVISMKFSNTALFSMPAAVVGILALSLASTPAVAATATAPIQVTATVVATCSVTATGLTFASYASTAASASTSTVTVQCTNGTSYTLGLNAGATTGATVTTRQMLNGAIALNYGLYTDSGHTTNFATLASATGTGLAVGTTVYGQVPAGQYVTPGTYTDTVTATVTY
jgi:spore coat protein U-like protein